MKKSFNKAVLAELERIKNCGNGILTENDLSGLPEIVRKYIRYCGFVGREKILCFRAEFRGGIRFKQGEKFMPLKSVQYNFTDVPSRLFYIKASKGCIPAVGLHLYRNAKAVFKIKALGLFTVVDASGPLMDKGETVTVLNDMCFISPAALIDKRIHWEVLDGLAARAVFTNENITVSAELFFNEKGELINFVSNDRCETDGREYKNYPWQTPVLEYKNFNGFLLPSKAQLIYKRPDGDFCYGEFELVSVKYNCRELK